MLGRSRPSALSPALAIGEGGYGEHLPPSTFGSTFPTNFLNTTAVGLGMLEGYVPLVSADGAEDSLSVPFLCLLRVAEPQGPRAASSRRSDLAM